MIGSGSGMIGGCEVGVRWWEWDDSGHEMVGVV